MRDRRQFTLPNPDHQPTMRTDIIRKTQVHPPNKNTRRLPMGPGPCRLRKPRNTTNETHTTRHKVVPLRETCRFSKFSPPSFNGESLRPDHLLSSRGYSTEELLARRNLPAALFGPFFLFL